uniref:Structural maintenance of chromosomes protein n=1 Tax=Rhabditophanes sp. KR3021 TaxID=114890 RepID=A0AC35TYU6_9BILA
MGRIIRLEVENFKSYKGKVIIGPFKDFTAIIGPNGSGKSNLMDAISFVLGEKTINLRVKKLSDLIHGMTHGQPVSNKCLVKMYYELGNGKMKVFSRGVVNSSSEYRINGDHVTPQVYAAQMEQENVFIKARNFLVYQGAVESIATKSNIERTQLFEEISRSNELVAKYNKLKEEMVKCEELAQNNMHRRKNIAQEKKEARAEKEEADKYSKKQKELGETYKQLYMMKLSFIERITKKAFDDVAIKKSEVEEIYSKKDSSAGSISSAMKAAKEANCCVKFFETEAHKVLRILENERPEFLKTKNEVVHVEGKLNSLQKSLVQLQKNADKQDKSIEEIKTKIKAIEHERNDALEKMKQASQDQNLSMEESDVAEYKLLKMKAGKKNATFSLKLDDVIQEYESSLNMLSHEKGKLLACEERLKTQQDLLDRHNGMIVYTEEQLEIHKNALEGEQQLLLRMEQEVGTANARMAVVVEELEVISKQLSDADGDSAESDRKRRKNEAYENLKRIFADRVYGRIVDLCEPSHNKFKLAVTKILSKQMMNIVCDTETTAKECMAYLKEQRYDIETFLPADVLNVTTLNERIRNFPDSKGIKLMFDVLQISSISNVRKAIQFICGNAVVCQTIDDAREMAYGHDDSQERFKAVSFDGTLFMENGMICTGNQDLMNNAKKWDEAALKKLRQKKNELQDEYQILLRNKQKEDELESKKKAIHQLENRVNITNQEVTKLRTTDKKEIEDSLATAQADYTMMIPRVEKYADIIEEKKQAIKTMEEKKDGVIDEVFAEFCARLNIPDIRRYEEREMRFHEESQSKLQEFDSELERWQFKYEYLQKEDKTPKIAESRAKVDELKETHTLLTQKQADKEKNIKEIEKEFDEINGKFQKSLKDYEDAEAAVSVAKKEITIVDKEVNAIEKLILQLEAKISANKTQRYDLLLECRLKSIELPLNRGTLNETFSAADVDMDDETSQSTNFGSQHPSSQMSHNQNWIELDYTTLDKEYKALKDDGAVKKHSEQLLRKIQDIENALSKLNAPNVKALERIDQFREREAESTEEWEAARRRNKEAKDAFEKVKVERNKRFQLVFENVQNRIDEIYKVLSGNQSAQAFLGADNLEEPYLDGISYNCVAPGKRFRPMDQLSGGEKTIAALALLFAIHSSNPSPFFVLDEIDAALDNSNISKVVTYVAEKSKRDFQVIVISLKEEMFYNADCLVGIYSKVGKCTNSGVLSVDLTEA